jgi:rRNA maturation RNase YbeY
VPVLLRNLQRAVPINTSRLRRTAEAILTAADAEDLELSVLLVSDHRIRALNARYRNKDRSTDVLAFPLREGVFIGCSGGLLGDVVISLPTAKRQADELGQSLFDEVVRLLVHGIVHLLGYDHERGQREAARMTRREHVILRKIREQPVI